MTITNALASIAVESLPESLVWYEYLFGRKADARPMADVAEWKLPGGGWVHVATDADRAGASVLMLIVDDIADELGRLEMFGIKPVAKAIGDFFKTAKLRDPDGNMIVLSQPQQGDVLGMLRALPAPSVLIVLSFLAAVLNRDIAGLVSGMDQITNYPAHATASVVNLATPAIQIAFAVACMVSTAWAPVAIVRGPLFHTAIVLTSWSILASVYVAFIDSGDMYPHVNEERLLVNGAVYLLIFLVAGTSRPMAAR